MTPVSIVACIVIVWALFADRFGSVAVAWAGRFNPPTALARACALALLPLLAAQIVLLTTQVRLENGPPTSDWMQRLPLPVYDHHTERASVHALFAYIAYAIAALETLCVALVAYAEHRGTSGIGRRFAVLLTLGFAILSIAAPSMSTTDPYEYVASGMLGMRSYAPGPDPFAGTVYAAIDAHIPMRGVIYGPLWLAIDTAVTHGFPTILSKLIALRVFNAALMGALLWALARARVPRAALLAVAFNPALWYFIVVNLHADVEGLVPVALAFAFAQRGKGVWAMVLVAVAGLIKVPFVVAGAAAFAPLSMRRRLLLWAGAAGLAFGISYLIPGPVYLGGVAGHVDLYAAKAHSRGIDEYIYVIPFVCAFMFALVAFGRSFLGAPWLFGQMSPLTAPWYLFWGMPYAFATGQFALYLAALPLFTVMRDLNYLGIPLPLFVVVGTICAFAFDAYLVTRRRFTRAPARYIL